MSPQLDDDRYPSSEWTKNRKRPRSIEDKKKRRTHPATKSTTTPSSSCRFFTPYQESMIPSTLSHHRHQDRQRIGVRLAAKRLGTSVSDEDSQGATHGAVVNYRRPMTLSPLSYVKSIFLDDGRTALFLDQSGQMDILRLDYVGNNTTNAGEEQQLSSKSPFMVQGLRVTHESSCASLLDFSQATIQSLDGGRKFVVGSPSGHCHVFHAERASQDESSASSPNNNPAFMTRYNNLSSPRASVNSSNSIIPLPYITSVGWTCGRPHRQYGRSYAHNRSSNGGSSIQDQFYLEQAGIRHDDAQIYDDEIAEWETSYVDARVITPRRSSRGAAMHQDFLKASRSRWAFLETMPSSALLTAHIDPDHDCFWMQLQDSRVSGSGTSRATSSSSYHKPVICVERRNSKQATATTGNYATCITSCRFVSECLLATVETEYCNNHDSSCYYDGLKTPQTVQRSMSTLKVWDIRRITKDRPRDTISIPAFPKNPCLDVEEAFSSRITTVMEDAIKPDQYPSHGHGVKKDALRDTSARTSTGTSLSMDAYPVTELSGCGSNNHSNTASSMIVTSSSPEHLKTCHHVYDLARMKVQRTVVQSHGKQDQHLPLYAISDSHSSIGLLDRKNQSVGIHSLLLNGKSSRALFPEEDCHQSRNWRTKPMATLDFRVQDCYGCTTDLSCLAYNWSGTTMIGASTDGDIFSWNSSAP